jgi:hypothetical protein
MQPEPTNAHGFCTGISAYLKVGEALAEHVMVYSYRQARVDRFGQLQQGRHRATKPYLRGKGNRDSHE